MLRPAEAKIIKVLVLRPAEAKRAECVLRTVYLPQVSTPANGKAGNVYKKRESAHKKRETSSSKQLSSFLAFSSFFNVFVTWRHFDEPFSFALTSLARKCALT